MTIIEQASQVLAPLLTSYTLVYGGYRLACLVFIGANLVTWFVEHLLLSRFVFSFIKNTETSKLILNITFIV